MTAKENKIVSPSASERPRSSQENSFDSLHGSSKSASSYFLYGTRGAGKMGTARPKTDVEWAMYRARGIPGPGEYQAECGTLCKVSGGRFNMSRPKSDVEWAILTAREIPGPGKYVIPANSIRGGKFSSARPRTDIDILQRKAREEPGPGQYEGIDRCHKISGGRFSTAHPKSDVEVAVRFAKAIPGPGQYQADAAYKISGGRFNIGKSKSDVEWSIIRAAKTPGPCQYEPDSHYKVTGGKFSSSRPKSAMQWVEHRAKLLPGPGEYNQDIETIGTRSGSHGLRASTPSLPLTQRPKSSNTIPPEARRRPKSRGSETVSIPSSPSTSREFNTGRHHSIPRASSAPPTSENVVDSRPATRVSTPESGLRKPRLSQYTNIDSIKTSQNQATKADSELRSHAASIRERLRSAQSERGRKSSPQREVNNDEKTRGQKNGRSYSLRITTLSEPIRQDTTSRSPSVDFLRKPAGKMLHLRNSQGRAEFDISAKEDPLAKARSNKIPYKIRSESNRATSPQISNENIASLFSAEEAKAMRFQHAQDTGSSRPTQFSFPDDNGASRPVPRAWKEKRGKKSRPQESPTPEHRTLSKNAMKLLDLAMQSPEFRNMMGVYGEAQDPTSMVQKYLWSFQPLFAQ